MQDESTAAERLSHDRQADADAIRELLDRQVSGWDTGDPGAYASVFTPDADYVTFLGTHHRGRDAIAAAYVPLFRKLLKNSRLECTITQLRFLTPPVPVCLRAWASRTEHGGTSAGGTAGWPTRPPGPRPMTVV